MSNNHAEVALNLLQHRLNEIDIGNISDDDRAVLDVIGPAGGQALILYAISKGLDKNNLGTVAGYLTGPLAAFAAQFLKGHPAQAKMVTFPTILAEKLSIYDFGVAGTETNDTNTGETEEKEVANV